jgi:dihydroorotate dehydrogenase electron transfer subunit
MPPRVMQALVAESKAIEPDLYWLRLSAPDIGASLRAGQFLTLVHPERLSPYLPTPIHPTHIGSEELGCLLWPGERERWLLDFREGDSIQVTAPLGNPFALEPRTHNLLIVAEGMSGLPLLPLAQEAAGRKMEASFLVWSPFSRAGLLPPGLLPSSAEYRTAVGQEALAESLAATLQWANQVCAAGSPELYLALWEAIQRARMRYAKGFCQVLLRRPMMCGTGLCGQCQTRLRRGLVQVCTDGPVFDLKDVIG